MIKDLDKRESLLNIVKLRGPVLPADVHKQMGTDLMFAAAMLAELVSNRNVRITNVKMGGSPFYYLDGQEFKLQDLMKHLNSKDREVAERLKKEKIIRDNDCSSLERFSLRQIKDYAYPIKVNNNNQVEIFWRWYLFSEEDAKREIVEILTPRVEEPIREIQQVEEKIAEVKLETSKLKIETPKVKEEIKEEKKEPKKRVKKIAKKDLGFEDRVLDFFNKSGIEIVEEKMIKKDKEMNYVARVNSGIGKLDYFVKVKNKDKISESDLSLALNEAGKLPCLFVSNGELSKGAEENLNTILKGVVFKKI